MLVVNMSVTPLVGVPILLTRLMNKLDGVQARCVQHRNRYSDGRVYDKDLLYADEQTKDVLKKADVIIIHNRIQNMELLKLIEKKRKILICHSQPHHIEKDLMEKADAVAVVAQYQPRLYKGIKFSLVPNLIPLDDPLYMPAERKPGMWVSFAPSNVNEWDPKSEYRWDQKGHKETLRMLNLAGIDYEFMTTRPLNEVLQKSQRCHITIDEVITGAYHRRTLEGCAHGTLTLNAADNYTLGVMQHVSGCRDVPFFVVRSIGALAGVFSQAKRCPGWVRAEGNRARTWMEKNWDPMALLKRCYMPLLVGDQIQLFS